MAKKKSAAEAVATEEYTPDALAIRTCNKDGSSHSCFIWPLTVGAIVTAPDWNARAECGGGLHGLLDGIGDWELTARADAVWQVVGVKRSECVDIDGGKVKFPRCRVEYVGGFAQAMQMVQKAIVTKLLEMAQGNTATGDRGHAAATGYSGHAAATGYSGHAAATGDRGHAAATGDRGHAAATGDSGHAAATGYSGHAAATGYSGHAAATGDSGHAAATGDSGHAAATGKFGISASLGWNGTAHAGADGAIVLAFWNDNFELVHVFASRVGENGIEAGKTYRLNADGKPVLA